MICIGVVIMWCSTAAVPAATAGAKFCDVAKPIYWSRADTRLTKEQADELNAKGKRLCGWKGK